MVVCQNGTGELGAEAKLTVQMTGVFMAGRQMMPLAVEPNGGLQEFMSRPNPPPRHVA